MREILGMLFGPSLWPEPFPTTLPTISLSRGADEVSWLAAQARRKRQPSGARPLLSEF